MKGLKEYSIYICDDCLNCKNFILEEYFCKNPKCICCFEDTSIEKSECCDGEKGFLYHMYQIFGNYLVDKIGNN